MHKSIFFFPCAVGPAEVKKIVVPVTIAAALVIVAVPFVIWIYRKRRRNDIPLIEGGNPRGYQTINNFGQSGERRKDTNRQQNVSQPMPVSSSSCSDISEPNKDLKNDFSNGGRASAPV